MQLHKLQVALCNYEIAHAHLQIPGLNLTLTLTYANNNPSQIVQRNLQTARLHKSRAAVQLCTVSRCVTSFNEGCSQVSNAIENLPWPGAADVSELTPPSTFDVDTLRVPCTFCFLPICSTQLRCLDIDVANSRLLLFGNINGNRSKHTHTHHTPNAGDLC